MRYSKPDPLPEGAVLRVVTARQCVAFEGIEYDASPLGLFAGDTVAVAHSKAFAGEVCALVVDGTDAYEVVLKRSKS